LLALVGVHVLAGCALSHRGPADAARDTQTPDVPDVIEMDTPDVTEMDAPDVIEMDTPDVIEMDTPDVRDVPDVQDVQDVQDVPDVPDAQDPMPVLLSANFVALNTGPVMPGAMPANFTLRRDSEATVQTGPSSVAIVPNGLARIGQRDTLATRGLVIEESRTNLLGHSREYATMPSMTWDTRNTGTCQVTTNDTSTMDPTGTTSNAERVVTGNAMTCPRATLNASMPHVGTVWAKIGPGMSMSDAAVPPLVQFQFDMFTFKTITSSWQRIEQSINASPGPWQVNPGASPGADLYIDFYQVERGQWPSEAIVTADMQGTRAGERLCVPLAMTRTVTQRVRMELELIPKGARTEYTASTPLTIFHYDDANYAEINPATGQVTITVNGVSKASQETVSWNRHDTVKLFVDVGALGVSGQFRVNNAPLINLTFPALPLPGGFTETAGDLCIVSRSEGGMNVKQFSSWLRTVRFLAWNAQPSL
jgi:hypothetical protein